MQLCIDRFYFRFLQYTKLYHMKDKLTISTAQFEHRNGDKKYNLSVIESLAHKAALEGSNVVAFHECCITGYTFARHLSKDRDAGPGGICARGTQYRQTRGKLLRQTIFPYWPACLKKTGMTICSNPMFALIKPDWWQSSVNFTPLSIPVSNRETSIVFLTCMAGNAASSSAMTTM